MRQAATRTPIQIESAARVPTSTALLKNFGRNGKSSGIRIRSGGCTGKYMYRIFVRFVTTHPEIVVD
jgi:hypothetical protein